MKQRTNQGGVSMYRENSMDHDEGSNQTATAIFAFFAGACLGAGIAILLAPQSGEKTRRMLSDYADKAKDQMDTAIESGKEYLQAGIQRGKEYFETAPNTAQETIKTAGDQLAHQAKTEQRRYQKS
jgi:gas vesicle protein